jgi:predicted DNA-binding WGR domain protein
MITLVHHHAVKPSFHRVDVGYNLFGEYSLVREWGVNGQNGVHRITWFSNLRDAVMAADKWHMKASTKGYQLTERLLAGSQ